MQTQEDIVAGRLVGLAAALVLGTGLLAPGFVLAAAYEPPVGTVEYVIEHSKYDEIGTHKLTFSRSGKDVIVDVEVRIKVKLLFITAHSVAAERRETWRDGRLVTYSSWTKENKTLIEVSARTESGKLVVEGPEGRAEAGGPVFPTNPWHPEVVKAGLLMDTKTGKLLKVSVAPAGEGEVAVAGKWVNARKYTISGDLERDVWFDADGNLLQFRFVNDGATLTFTRVTPLP